MGEKRRVALKSAFLDKTRVNLKHLKSADASNPVSIEDVFTHFISRLGKIPKLQELQLAKHCEKPCMALIAQIQLHWRRHVLSCFRPRKKSEGKCLDDSKDVHKSLAECIRRDLATVLEALPYLNADQKVLLIQAWTRGILDNYASRDLSVIAREEFTRVLGPDGEGLIPAMERFFQGGLEALFLRAVRQCQKKEGALVELNLSPAVKRALWQRRNQVRKIYTAVLRMHYACLLDP